MAQKVQRSSENEIAKIAGENNVACIFYAEDITNYECEPEKQTVNGKF
jgi:hypothetical protein